MAFLDLMQQLFKHTRQDHTVPARVADLRARLTQNPNDAAAFDELAAIAYSADTERQPRDPLTADTTAHIDVSGNLAVWALAEELSSDAGSWYPQLQLAKLALPGDPEHAIRLLNVAVDRRATDEVLIEAMTILREAGRADAAMNLGVAHWDPARQGAAVGSTLIEVALAAGRGNEAKAYFRELAPYIDEAAQAELSAHLEAAE